MTPIVDEFKLIQEHYKILKGKLYKEEAYKKEYSNSFPLLDNLEQNILNQLQQLNPNFNRPKRGIINGLGSIIKVITGNLDQDDAERYDKQITTISQNQNKIKTILTNQITILNSTIANFNELAQNLSHNQIILESRIQRIEADINYFANHEIEHYQYFLTYSLLTQLTFLYQNIYDILGKIETASTFAKLNTLHNSIINPAELLLEIRDTKKNLINAQLPFEPEINNILKYEKIINIKGYSRGFTVIYILEIPLIENENFQFFELYTLPVQVNYTYQLLLPKTKYIALGIKNYVLINKDCIFIDNNEYLCKDVNPIPIYKKPPCEIALLSYNTDLNDCHPINIEITETQIQKIKPNKWIAIIPQEITITLTCNKIITKSKLQGTFIIELNKDCQILIENQVLQTHISNSHEMKFELPKLNITYSQKPKINYHPGPLQIEAINNHKLLETQNLLTEQSKRIQEINDVQISYSTSVWTILLYVLLLFLLLYVVYLKIFKKYIGKRKQCKTPPTDEIIV